MFEIRQYHTDDFKDLLELQQLCFPEPYPIEQLWNLEQIKSHEDTFPSGALSVWDDNNLVGSATLIKTIGPCLDKNWYELSGNGYISGVHEENGDYLYMIDLCSNPHMTGKGIAKKLVKYSITLYEKLNLKGLVLGSRIPGYINYRDLMDIESYIENVFLGHIKDPTLSFFVKLNPTLLKIKSNYLHDAESCDYGIILLF